MQVPFSSGEAKAELVAPEFACDSHFHTYDSRVPSTPPEAAKPDATIGDYRLLQQRIGTSRGVIVNASNYAYNNEVTLDAIAAMGIANARGIGVVNTDVTDAELKRLDDAGIRGIRITRRPVTSWDNIRILAGRVAALGWHVQFNLPIDQVFGNIDTVRSLPTRIVFDHLARINDLDHPALPAILRLLEGGRTWIKLSGVYLDEPDGGPAYPKSVAVAKAYVEAAPERLVWGSDWPHPSAKVKPDDAGLFDLNRVWAPDEAVRNRILVENPRELYGFD